MSYQDFMDAVNRSGVQQNSPYSPDNPFATQLQGGQLPQVNEFSRIFPHQPGIAAALNSAALLTSMIPTGMTTGENISNVGKAMSQMPYARLAQQAQMLQPAQQFEGAQADIKSKRASALSDIMQGMYAAQRPDIEREQMQTQLKVAQLQRDTMLAEHRWDSSESYDDKGYGPYKYDNISGQSVYKGQAPQPPGYQPSFRNQQKQRALAGLTEPERVAGGLSLPGVNIARQQLGLQPLPESQAGTFYDTMNTVRSQMAQANAQGGANVSQPFARRQAFVADQAKPETKFLNQPAPLTSVEDYQKWAVSQAMASGWNKGAKTGAPDLSTTGFDAENSRRATARGETERLFGLYDASDAPDKGISFQNWRAAHEASSGENGMAKAYEYPPKSGKWFYAEGPLANKPYPTK